MFSSVLNMNTDFKYYKDESEIEELLNKDTIENNNSESSIDDICEKTIDYIITLVINKNSETESLTDNDNVSFMINLIKNAMHKNPPKESNSKPYLGIKNIKLIIKNIQNFDKFRNLIITNDNDEIKKYLEDFHKKLSVCKKNGDFTSNFPESIVKCIIKMYS